MVDALKKTYYSETAQQQEEAYEDEVNQAKKSHYIQAVRGVSFSVTKGESFVLLGVNGAGKSSTFKCLTGEEPQTGGDVSIRGVPIVRYRDNIDRLKNMMGYCP